MNCEASEKETKIPDKKRWLSRLHTTTISQDTARGDSCSIAQQVHGKTPSQQIVSSHFTLGMEATNGR